MAAALAAATLSAAAVGFTGAVLFTARLLVAEAELLFVTLGLGPAVAEEAVLAGVTLGPVPVFLGGSSGLVLVVAVEGLDSAGLDLLLEAEAELALETFPDMLAGVLLVAAVGRLEASVLGSLVTSLLCSVLGLDVVIFFSSGLGTTPAFFSGLADNVFGICLSTVPDLLFLSEPVVGPDLIDLRSSNTLERPVVGPVFGLLRDAVVVVVVVVLLDGADLAAGVCLTVVLVAVTVLASGWTCLDPGLGFVAAGVFFGELFASGASFTSPGLFSAGAGDLSLTGVAGVIFTLGMARLTAGAVTTLSPVSTEVSFSSC